MSFNRLIMSTSFFNQYLQVETWLQKYRIENYIIRDNLTVDVDGHVFLIAKRLSNIPIQFGIVTGEFNCSANFLTSLKGVPFHVKGDFACNQNFLKDLAYAPLEVEGHFLADNNKIVSLEGITSNLNKLVDLHRNEITSLAFLPLHIQHLYIVGNPIENYEALFEMDDLHSLSIVKYKEERSFTSRNKPEIQEFIEQTKILYEKDKLSSMINVGTSKNTIKI